MKINLLKPGEKIDDLIINDYKIIQSDEEFKFSLDAVLLANFAHVKSNSEVVDLGTGTGVVALLMVARGARKVYGIEISPTVADMASRSVKLNNLGEKVDVYQADMRNLKEILPAGRFDTVVSNPPYYPVGHGKCNLKDRVTQARHEVTANLEDVISAAKYLLKYRGRFAMIHLAERISEVIPVMCFKGLEPKRLQLIYPRINKKPTLMLIEGVFGAKPGMDVLPPLIVYNADGGYTEDIKKIYQHKGDI